MACHQRSEMDRRLAALQGPVIGRLTHQSTPTESFVMPFERQPSVLAFFVGTPLVGQERLGEFIQKDIQGGVGFGAFCDHALIQMSSKSHPALRALTAA